MGELWCRDCGDSGKIKKASMLCDPCGATAWVLECVMSFNIAASPGDTVTLSPGDVRLTYSSFGTFSIAP